MGRLVIINNKSYLTLQTSQVFSSPPCTTPVSWLWPQPRWTAALPFATFWADLPTRNFWCFCRSDIRKRTQQFQPWPEKQSTMSWFWSIEAEQKKNLKIILFDWRWIINFKFKSSVLLHIYCFFNIYQIWNVSKLIKVIFYSIEIILLKISNSMRHLEN